MTNYATVLVQHYCPYISHLNFPNFAFYNYYKNKSTLMHFKTSNGLHRQCYSQTVGPLGLLLEFLII